VRLRIIKEKMLSRLSHFKLVICAHYLSGIMELLGAREEKTKKLESLEVTRLKNFIKINFVLQQSCLKNAAWKKKHRIYFCREVFSLIKNRDNSVFR